ncbi:ArsR family transcriptional regulator [Heyndrickxia shackletonii]|uniref:ArsR family transcriptional regulator n=1 Tax=Heyndrickxia shackletonii TaxID=157838 RepID=A0A0Q3TFA8_9BACI|nr:metalloregulator ArsR/SmtB family transcription factor [Heyndrickxia shackletonii]KQL52305.1 ArsR family transcriptional regulator [Heyndrickxia shackletonii]NEZ00324.1 winged helix-turn-helix transcriptional regulator [Heyndrickxia shackletonii]
MDVLNLTSRKRKTYKIQLKYSIFWECALGIAAITNARLLHTLDKPASVWEEIRSGLSQEMRQQLDFVEEHNTWKALLQLLHQQDFSELPSFISYIKELSNLELKFICLPFIGSEFQEMRQQSVLGDAASVKEMKNLTSDNPFFPDYIEFICNADGDLLKEHLIAVVSGWYQFVLKKDEEKIQSILKTDYESKKRMADKLTPEELVEWATGGVTYNPEPSVNYVLLIPQYTYRPWNIAADLEDTKVYYYPVANESIYPNDRYAPNNFLVLKHKALGDEARLRIVKLLYEGDRTLQEITEHLDVGKSTIHHHLKILRSAKLVEIIDSKYSLKRKSLDMLAKELEYFLKG